MIGFSGVFNFDLNNKLNEFENSNLLKELVLKTKKIKRDNFIIQFIKNSKLENIFEINNEYYLCLGDIYNPDNNNLISISGYDNLIKFRQFY